jgi:hypothetical protein
MDDVGLGDLVIETDGRTIDEVADDIVRRTGWLDLEEA